MTVIDCSAKDLIARRPPATLSWSTGLEAIDAATGGFCRGRIWVLTGEPGIGKTVLLCQLAYRLAVDHRIDTVLHGYRGDGILSYRRWLLAMVPGLHAGNEPDLDDPRLCPLMDADLVVSDCGYEIPRWADAGVTRRALLIDDPEFKSDPVLDAETRSALRAAADSGAIVIVTSPLRHCYEQTTGPGRTQLRQEWSETADVILELIPQDDPWDLELVIRRNRHGPCATQPLARGTGGTLVRRAEPTGR